MKAIVQRVLSASVTVEKAVVSSISQGLLVLAAVAPEDDEKDMASMARKILALKIWEDENGGKWKKNVTDIGGEILCGKFNSVSIYTSCIYQEREQNFHGAASPKEAKRLYDILLQKIAEGYKAERVKDGVFQAMMQVASVNDGPVTLELNSGAKQVKKAKEPAATATSDETKDASEAKEAAGAKEPNEAAMGTA